MYYFMLCNLVGLCNSAVAYHILCGLHLVLHVLCLYVIFSMLLHSVCQFMVIRLHLGDALVTFIQVESVITRHMLYLSPIGLAELFPV